MIDHVTLYMTHCCWQGGGVVLSSDSPNTRFTLQGSSVNLDDGARMTLKNSLVTMMASNFTSNGTIEVASGSFLDEVEIAACRFEGARLLFGDMTNSLLIMRNNEGTRADYFEITRGFPQQCDAAQTGETARCDRRAQCTNKASGVKCICRTALSFKPGTHDDGSMCVIDGQLLDIYQTTSQIHTRVRKPVDSHVPFTVVAQSEKTFNATVRTDAQILLIDGKQSTQSRYALSPAKPERSNDFNLTVLGGKLRWPDTEANHSEVVIVEAPRGSAVEGGTQKLKVTVTIAPYGSCQHTDVRVDGLQATVEHNKADKIRLRIVAMDSNGFAIEKTPFNAPSNTQLEVQLFYEDAPAGNISVVRNSSNGSHYSAAVPLEHVRKRGRYRLEISLSQAWDKVTATVRQCPPEQGQTSWRTSGGPQKN